MARPKSPCMTCETRSEGCHASCKDYEEFKEELKSYKDDLYKIRSEQHRMDSYYHHKRKWRS